MILAKYQVWRPDIETQIAEEASKKAELDGLTIVFPKTAGLSSGIGVFFWTIALPGSGVGIYFGFAAGILVGVIIKIWLMSGFIKDKKRAYIDLALQKEDELLAIISNHTKVTVPHAKYPHENRRLYSFIGGFLGAIASIIMANLFDDYVNHNGSEYLRAFWHKYNAFMHSALALLGILTSVALVIRRCGRNHSYDVPVNNDIPCIQSTPWKLWDLVILGLNPACWLIVWVIFWTLVRILV